MDEKNHQKANRAHTMKILKVSNENQALMKQKGKCT